MSEGFPDRLTQLRSRWQADRSSRIFLQLAEEYRHLGRVQDALEVLDAGLQEHPGYLSALVAKGRCLLEVGDAGGARQVLERVVQQDATQMVANKLLVRAYLETGEPERARHRLDTYILLNDSDPEIEELQRRVVAMSRPPRDADEPRAEEPAEGPQMGRTETPQGLGAGAEVFDLGSGGPVLAPAGGDDLFELPPLPLPAPPASPVPVAPASQAPASSPVPQAPPAAMAQMAQLAQMPQLAQIAQIAQPVAPASAAAAPAALPARALVRGEGNGAEPFPDLAPEHSRRLYLAALAAEEIFSFPAPPPPVASPAPAPEAPPSQAPDATGATVSEAPPLEHEPSPSPAATEGGPRAAGTTATATLGELYLRQGHLEEAERIFREVAAREPGNAAALQALAGLSRETPAVPSPSSVVAPAPAPAVEPSASAAVPAVSAEVPPAAAPPSAGAAASPVAAASPAAPAPSPSETAPLPPAAPPPLAAAELLAGAGAGTAATPVARKVAVLHGYLARLRQARRVHVS